MLCKTISTFGSLTNIASLCNLSRNENIQYKAKRSEKTEAMKSGLPIATSLSKACRSKSLSMVSFSFKIGYLIGIFLVLASQTEAEEACAPLDFAPGGVITVEENKPAGTPLFEIPVNGAETWTYHLGRTDTVDGTPWMELQAQLKFMRYAGQYEMVLQQPLDLEEIYTKYGIKLTSLTLLLVCQLSGGSSQTNEVFLIVRPVNEWAPEFKNSPLETSIPENMKVGSKVYTLRPQAIDKDVNPSVEEISSFRVWKYELDPLRDGRAAFNMNDSRAGNIVLQRSLDYEELDFTNTTTFYLNVSVSDVHGLTAFTTLALHVMDVDDLPPEFYHPGCSQEGAKSKPCLVSYAAMVPVGYKGPLTNLTPGDIQAKDMDSLDASIVYSLERAPGESPETFGQFTINQTTGIVDLKDAFTKPQVAKLVVVASEVSEVRRSTQAALQVTAGNDQGDFLLLGGSRDPALLTKKNENDNRPPLYLIVTLVLALMMLIVHISLFVMCINYYTDRRVRVRPVSAATGDDQGGVFSYSIPRNQNPDGTPTQTYSNIKIKFASTTGRVVDAQGKKIMMPDEDGNMIHYPINPADDGLTFSGSQTSITPTEGQPDLILRAGSPDTCPTTPNNATSMRRSRKITLASLPPELPESGTGAAVSIPTTPGNATPHHPHHGHVPKHTFANYDSGAPTPPGCDSATDLSLRQLRKKAKKTRAATPKKTAEKSPKKPDKNSSANNYQLSALQRDAETIDLDTLGFGELSDHFDLGKPPNLGRDQYVRFEEEGRDATSMSPSSSTSMTSVTEVVGSARDDVNLSSRLQSEHDLESPEDVISYSHHGQDVGLQTPVATQDALSLMPVDRASVLSKESHLGRERLVMVAPQDQGAVNGMMSETLAQGGDHTDMTNPGKTLSEQSSQILVTDTLIIRPPTGPGRHTRYKNENEKDPDELATGVIVELSPYISPLVQHKKKKSKKSKRGRHARLPATHEENVPDQSEEGIFTQEPGEGALHTFDLSRNYGYHHFERTQTMHASELKASVVDDFDSVRESSQESRFGVALPNKMVHQPSGSTKSKTISPVQKTRVPLDRSRLQPYMVLQHEKQRQEAIQTQQWQLEQDRHQQRKTRLQQQYLPQQMQARQNYKTHRLQHSEMDHEHKTQLHEQQQQRERFHRERWSGRAVSEQRLRHGDDIDAGQSGARAQVTRRPPATAPELSSSRPNQERGTNSDDLDRIKNWVNSTH